MSYDAITDMGRFRASMSVRAELLCNIQYLINLELAVPNFLTALDVQTSLKRLSSCTGVTYISCGPEGWHGKAQGFYGADFRSPLHFEMVATTAPTEWIRMA
jgi:hypothetical protein